MPGRVRPKNSHPHAPLVEYAVQHFGADSTALHLIEGAHQRFWALASLTGRIGIPYHMAIPKVLDHPDPYVQKALVTQLPQFFKLPTVQNALANGNPLDIGSIMTAAGFTTFNQDVTAVMNRVLRGSHFFMETIRTGLEKAIEKGQTLGVEIEFTPQPGQTRDDAYSAIKARLESEGHTVTLLKWDDLPTDNGQPTGDQDFVYGKKPGIFPTTLGHFKWSGTEINTQLLFATGSVMHTVTKGPDDSVRLKAKSETPDGAAEELYARIAETLNLGSVSSVKSLMASGAPYYTETRMYLLKDSYNDIAKVEIKLLPNGKTRLTGNNCQIFDESGQPMTFIDIDAPGTTDAERFTAVDAYLHARVKNNRFARKVDKIGGMLIDDIPKPFQIVVEAHPDLELVTPILTADQTNIVSLLIEGIKRGGFEGTRAANVVGVHVHAGLPMTFRNATGELVPTIAPVVNLMRAYGMDVTDIVSAIPTHPNRIGFLHDVRPELIDLFNEPNYVTDPTDPNQILRVCADLVRHSRTKYTALNLDNHISKLLGAMLLGDPKEKIEPALKIGGEADQTYTVEYDSPNFGKLLYVFQTVETSYGVNIRLLTQLPEIRPAGEDGKPLPYVDLIRIKDSAWKKTAEWRPFNTELNDSKIVALNMQFVASYVWKYAKPYLMPQTQLQEMRQTIVNSVPARPVSKGQAGYANLDVMSLGGIRAVSAMMDAFDAIPTPAKQVAANTARGGATMYLGQMGADVIDAARTGNWSRFQTIKPAAEARDLGVLMAGSQVGQVLTTAAVTPIPTSIMPMPLKGIAVRAGSLAAGVTLLNALRTGELHLEDLPKTIGVTLAASGSVKFVTTILSRSKTAVAAAEMFKLSHAGRATFLGAVFTSVAEFTVMREIQRKLFRDANQPNLDKVRDYATQLIQADIVIQQAREAGEPVDPKVATAVRTQLKQLAQQVKAIPDIDEQIAIAEFEQNKLDLYNGKNLAISAGVQSGEADWNMTKELRRLERSHASRVASIRDDLGRQSVESLRTAEEFQPEDIADSGLPLPGDINGTSLESTKPRPIQGTLGNSWSTLALQLNDYLAQPAEAMVAMN